MDVARLKRGYIVINKKRHPVFEGLNPVGRNKQSTIPLLDHTVSHQQAAVIIIGDKHYICDMNSCNGTQLDHIKLTPLQLYELCDKKKIYFGNVKATYETVSQDSNSQEVSQNLLSQINDSIFDGSTQSLSAVDVATCTRNIVDSRAIGDHAHFENCLIIPTEQCPSEIIEPPVNENNIRDIETALQIETNRNKSIDNEEYKKKAVETTDLSSLSIHELPTQLIEGDFDIPSCSNNVKDNEKDTENNNGKEDVKKALSIYDMQTQIDIEPDDSKQVNEELLNLPDKTWDEDFFTQNNCAIHDEPTQLIAPAEDTSSVGAMELATTIEDQDNKISIKSLPNNDQKQADSAAESSYSEEDTNQLKVPNESNIIEETIINDTIQNNEEDDMNVDEDSNCSADFLTMQPVTQFFEDNIPGTTVQVIIIQADVKNPTGFDSETSPNEYLETIDSGSTTSNLTSKVESKSSDDNFASSLKTNLLKRKVKNVITSDDETKEKDGESSDETDVEAQPASEINFPSSLNTNLLKYKVRNVIVSDDEEKQSKSPTVNSEEKNEESSDETDVESPIKENNKGINKTVSSSSSENQVTVNRRKKLTKKLSPLKSNQKSDSDSDDGNDKGVCKKKTSSRRVQKIDEENNKDKIIEGNVEGEKVSKDQFSNSILNDSDFIPATQNSPLCPIPSLNQKKIVSTKASVAPQAPISEESVDYSLNLMLTQSLTFDVVQASNKHKEVEEYTQNNKEAEKEDKIVRESIKEDQKDCVKENEKLSCIENTTSPSPVSDNITIIENDDDDIFLAATQPLTLLKGDASTTQTSALLSAHFGDGNDDDIFLKATQEICNKGDAAVSNFKQENMINAEKMGPLVCDKNGKVSDIFEQATQVIDGDDICMPATQPLVPQQSSFVKKAQTEIEKKSIPKMNEDCLFLQPTRSVLKGKIAQSQLASVKKNVQKSNNPPSLDCVDCDDEFMPATQPLILNNIQKSNKVVDSVGDNCDDDIFMEATQPLVINNDKKSNKVESSVGNSYDADMFMEATQPLVINSDQKSNKAASTTRDNAVEDINDDNDTFLPPTQPLAAFKNDTTTEAIKTNEENIDNNNSAILPPTQQLSLEKANVETQESDKKTDLNDCKKPKLEICKFPVIQVRGDIFNTPPSTNKDAIEAAMQKLFQSQQSQEDVFFRRTPSIESQLELLFASQSHSIIRNECRPQNPLANILENLQSQHAIVLPHVEEKQVNGKDKDSLKAQERKESAEIQDQDKSEDQDVSEDHEKVKEQDQKKDDPKEKELDKNKEQVKDTEPEKSKNQKKIKDQDKEQEKDKEQNKIKVTEKNKDREKKKEKEKSKSHKKNEKAKHKESKKDKESIDTKNNDEKKDKKHDRKTKKEDELMEILQASKVEKEILRRQAQKIRDEIENVNENQNGKEKPSSTLQTKTNSLDGNELAQKTGSKNLSSARSRKKDRSPIDSISKKSDDSVETKTSNLSEIDKTASNASLLPLVGMESFEHLNRRSSRASLLSKELNKEIKKTRASSNSSIETKRSEIFDGEDLPRKRARAHSSSPFEYASPRLGRSDNRRKQLKNISNEEETKPDITTEKPHSSKRTSTKGEFYNLKENEIKQQKSKNNVENIEENETEASKKPTKRSHRTQKSSKSPSPQLSEERVGDSTVKPSKSTTNILAEPNTPFGDNTDSSHSLRRSKRKSTNERISLKSRLKKHKKEPELSLIEELPEFSDRTDICAPPIEIIDLCENDSSVDLKKNESMKNCRIKEVAKTPIKATKSSCRIVHAASIPTSSKTEDDNSLAGIKRTRQKHRRLSSNSEDDFIVKTTIKRSKLDNSTPSVTQSSNTSDITLSNSSFPETSERSRRKLKPKVVFTMLDSPELESLIRRLGGSVVDTVESSTVLLTVNVKRSLKLLAAVGQGKPICSPTWLEECKKANKFLDPWDYILRDAEAENKWNFSLKQSLERSCNKKLFENYIILLLLSKAIDVLKGAIEACGGKCVQRCPVKYQEIENFVIVSSEENKSKYSKFSKNNPKPIIVTNEAIFDAVLRQEINFKSHLLM